MVIADASVGEGSEGLDSQSGASDYMATHLLDLTLNTPSVPRQTVRLADNSIVEATRVGSATLYIIKGTCQLMQRSILRVYHVPGLLGNLLSVRALVRKGPIMQFEGGGMD